VLGFGVGLVKRTLFRSDGTRMPIAEVQRVSFEDVLDGRAQLQTEVDRVRLGPLEILTVPGELYPELWLADAEGASLAERPEGRDFEDAAVPVALSSLLPADGWPVIVNQANDALGYIIPRSQYDTEAPRAYRANGQYGEINSLGPDTAPALLEAARALYAVP